MEDAKRAKNCVLFIRPNGNGLIDPLFPQVIQLL